MSALGEFPTQVKDVFVTKEKNDVGIYGVKFYIRGKPWVISIDDIHLFRKTGLGYTYLKFAQQSADDKAIWGAMLEKAWAKLRGNYLNSEGGIVKNGLRTLTGVPVYSYMTSELTD